MESKPSIVNRRQLMALRIAIPVLIAGLIAFGVGYPRWRTQRTVDEAVRLADQFDFAAARTQLTEVLANHPDHPRARFQMARLCRRTEDLSEATRHLGAAAKLGWPATEIELEHYLIEAQLAGPQGANERTLRLYVQTNSPDDRLILEALALGYRNAHYLEAAIGSYTLWIERYPDDWPPCFGRAFLMEYFEQFDAAEKDYRRLLDLNPGHLEGHRRYGSLLLLQKKDAPAAVPHFQAVLAKHPGDSEAILGMAECELLAGRPDTAREFTNRILTFAPDHPAASLLRARIEAETGRIAEANPWIARAERNPPDDPTALYQLSQVCSLAGRTDAAARHLARSRELSAGAAEATELYKRILREPKNPDLRRQLGDCNRKLGRIETALPWYFSALNEDPNHAATHRVLADHYQSVGDRPRAEWHRNRTSPAK